MDATCKVQDNIHVFRLVHNMCPEFWVHITTQAGFSRLFAIYLRSGSAPLQSPSPERTQLFLGTFHSCHALPYT